MDKVVYQNQNKGKLFKNNSGGSVQTELAATGNIFDANQNKYHWVNGDNCEYKVNLAFPGNCGPNIKVENQVFPNSKLNQNDLSSSISMFKTEYHH